ncbi:MAG: cas3 2 [Thermoanaerobacter sp.]|nr:cas3 2 [Thermoanaerobacter sp.]MDK2793204.1 CRISPR-associated endonuclease/helicase Cas3 [Deferribacteres bacterium]
MYLDKLTEKRWFAKSNGETLEEHTCKVENAFDNLRNFTNLNDTEQEIIRKLIRFHDLGKINPEFQNKMRHKLDIQEKFNWNNGNIPHEWLSPAFISEEEENEIKVKLEELCLDKDRFFNFFIFVLLSHHHRENKTPDDDLIKKMIQWINENYNMKLDYFYRIDDILNTYNTSENRKIWNLFFPYRVKWLGALMKSDYCASAGINPEQKYKGDYQNDFHSFLNGRKFNLRDFQIKAKENSDKSVILVASTGMGKTEAAMNWINGQKAFYLLGIRIAVNEMYKRFKSIFGENVSLLHGESSYFFVQDETGENEYETKIEKARKLSYPLTVATADQLITSVFKYPGFEFTYLTCSYSKIVMDEIQSFAPFTIAAIVVFLKEIHNLGGRFMLMTATLPPFLLKEFRDTTDITIFQPQLLNIIRHKISSIDEDIKSKTTKELINKNLEKKILIICNTIRKAQEVYDFIKEFKPCLIHSQFIGKDRKEKEKNIMEAQAPCIWISTQIVEASLDIDFDLLLTENASIEALLQRFGRCYRKREYKNQEPNIFIFKSEHKRIYDRYIFYKTWEIIKEYSNKSITEKDKQDMIKEVFKNIEKTDYYKEYKKQKDLLEIGYRSLSRIDAQEDLRQITNNYVTIPVDVYEENQEKINVLLKIIDNREYDKLERIRKQSELLDYTIPVQLFGKIINNLEDIPDSQFCKTHRIKILNGYQYFPDLGLNAKKIESEGDNEPDNII